MARTKGATANVFISLKELRKAFQDDAMILVSRKFLEMNYLQGQKTVEPELESPVEIQEVVDYQPMPSVLRSSI